MLTRCFLIHGIGSQTQDFADPLKQGVDRALQEIIQQKSKKDAVRWKSLKPADLVAYHVLYWANIGTDAQANLYRSLYPTFFAEDVWYKRKWNAIAKFSSARSLAVNLLGDVFAYLGQFQQAIKQTVFSQIRDALDTAFAANEPLSIIIVGHSLGSVILHDLIGGFLQYSYAGFETFVGETSVFTMGCPLSLFSLVAQRARPDRFRRWVNFLHQRDPIAFPMAELPAFKKVEDVEIRQFSWNPLTLHSAYWEHPHVHRGIAEEIVAHHENGIGVCPPTAVGSVPPEIFQPLGGGMNIAGLSQAYADFQDVPFKELITTAREIDFSNIYGGHWLQGHAQYFAKALQKSEVKVRACIIAPDNPGLPGLSQQFAGKSVDDIKRRIEEGTQELINTLTEAKKQAQTTGRLQVYHSKNVLNHSFYRFDDMLYFAPRPFASSKHASTPIPCFAFRKTSQPGGAYEWIMRDFEELLKNSRDATLYYDSAATGSSQ